MQIPARTKIRIGAALAALIVSFLLGFVPQYRKNTRCEEGLRTQRARIQALESDVSLGRARDLAAALFIETVNRNFGNATSRASDFFNHVRSVLSASGASGSRADLEWLLAQRDAVITTLARSDPAVQKQAQEILERTLHMTGPVKGSE
jgi:hypothetical protein